MRKWYLPFYIPLLMLLFPAVIAFGQTPASPTLLRGVHVYCEAPLLQSVSLEEMEETLQQQGRSVERIFKGHVLKWKEELAGERLLAYLTQDRFWIYLTIQAEQKDLAKELLELLAEEKGWKLQAPPRLASNISISIIDEKGMPARPTLIVPISSANSYFYFLKRDQAATQLGVPSGQLRLVREKSNLFWQVKPEKEKVQRVKALFWHALKPAQQKKQVPQSSLLPLLIFPVGWWGRRRKTARPAHKKSCFTAAVLLLLLFSCGWVMATEYVIMYKSTLPAGWQSSVINSLHTEHTDYQDLTFTNYVSEQLSNLQSIKPKYVIVVIERADGDPDFFDNVDNTMDGLDIDEFHDCVWTIITGHDSTQANNLVTASNASNDHTLHIGNPDGTLQGMGYVSNYLASIVTDDATNGGGAATKYVNTGTTNDPDCQASTLQTEINNDNKDCILFLDHGNTNLWGLITNHYFLGYGTSNEDLNTYDSSIYYQVNNNRNSFILADACLTCRISGSRTTNWSPWEKPGENYTGTANQNVMLAWVEDSPGFYCGNDSVGYSLAPHSKFVLHNMMKHGYTPAKAVQISKNIYQYILQNQTYDSSTAYDTDDFLLYLQREWLPFGDTTWNITIAGSTPNYTISYPSNSQVDQLPANARGYVYVDTDVQWTCNVNLTFGSEILVNPWSANNTMNSCLTEVAVEDTQRTNGVTITDVAAVLGGIFKPTACTKAINYAAGNPSDANNLWDHPWYGAGTTSSIEIFKCQLNTDEIIWVLAAGVTDFDSNSQYEWRINNAYSQSFGVNYDVEPVTQTVGPEEDASPPPGRKRRLVTLVNKGTQNTANVIAKVPACSGATSPAVTPVGGPADATNIVITTVGGTFVEFTFPINGSQTKQYYAYYTCAAATPTPTPTPTPSPTPTITPTPTPTTTPPPTPSPITTPTPTATATATPTATPTPTPTPTSTITPVPTITPTPTPVISPLVEFDFDTGPQGWTFRQLPASPLHVSHWDHASSTMPPSAIGIITPYDESTNYFALWDSLAAEMIPYHDESLYQVDWFFSTNRGTTNAAPSLRFRIGLNNQKAFSYSRIYPGDWLPLAQAPGFTTYTLFLEPPIPADGLFLAFSVIDWADDFRGSEPAGEVSLEEVSVARHELPSFSDWQNEDTAFQCDTCTTSAAPSYTAPVCTRAPSELSLASGVGANDVFGTWDTPTDLFTLEQSKFYRLRCNVSASPQLGGPDLRVRVHTDDYRYAWYSYYVSSYMAGESALPPEIGADYGLYLILPFATLPCHFSFDLIDFSSSFGGTLTLHDLSLHSHAF